MPLLLRQMCMISLLVLGGIIELCYTLQPITPTLAPRTSRLQQATTDSTLATKKVDSELTNMLDSLPKADKYSLLIQSISTSIMENNGD